MDLCTGTGAYWYKFGLYVVFTSLVITMWVFNIRPYEQSVIFSTEGRSNSGANYLVWSTKCRIPDLDPFNKEAKLFYAPVKYDSCRSLDLLTYTSKTNNLLTININKNVISSYSKNGIICCYENITRGNDVDSPDDTIWFSRCQDFQDSVTVSNNAVFVKCRNRRSKKIVYSNSHAGITLSDKILSKIKKNNNPTKPLSILFIGIDSISRLNLFRVMPKTYNFFNENNWLELKGYNKIGDNTFPNLMAILTGKNDSDATKRCNPKETGKLDECNLLWFDYRDLGYLTGYAEDEAVYSSFNFEKKGFTKEPTDYYFRPYILACERHLKKVRKYGMTYCLGPETSGERIMNIAKDFAITLKDHPHFGFFWMNSFSHNDINAPSKMDSKVRNFLDNISNSGILDNVMVIFLSDHGLRYGKIRSTRTGWLEERLPFVYFWMPKWFREVYPNAYQNLKINANRLTTPYDLYYTLQDILIMSGLNYTIKPSTGCPKCSSLFQEISKERSCEDASIPQHWCTCTEFKKIDSTNKTIEAAAEYILKTLFEYMKTRGDEYKHCAKLKVNKIISSFISTPYQNWYRNDTYLLIVLETKPGNIVLEATVQLNTTSTDFKMQGSVSRLNAYNKVKCVKDYVLKMYCVC